MGDDGEWIIGNEERGGLWVHGELRFGKDGRPVTSWEEWGRLRQDESYFRVGSDYVGPYWVSTVWVGLDMSLARSAGRTDLPPVIFETMVFDQEGLPVDDDRLGADVAMWRYCTEAEAREGHEATILTIRATLDDGTDEGPGL